MLKRLRNLALAAVITLSTGIAFGSFRYSLSPVAFVEQAVRVIAASVLAVAYRADMDYVEQAMRTYRVGAKPVSRQKVEERWRRLEAAVPGLKVLPEHEEYGDTSTVPFIYESPDAEYLQELKRQHGLDALVGAAPDEYGAMARLARWVGTRWDHGTDAVPGGNQVCNPSAVVRAGERGAKFWCEIAARTMVHAATAVGWQARLITASRDGYTWEHAVAELWSNQYRKWFVVDTDFNVILERDGVPLSAHEMVHEGESLQAAGELKVVPFADPKPSLPVEDLVPFFAYVHVDMRNDWCSRPLRRGSPAGGDRATWWTARDSLGPVLTVRKRVDNPEQFNWPVNVVQLLAGDAHRSGAVGVGIDLEASGYGPAIEAIEVALDDGGWVAAQGAVVHLPLSPGRHQVAGRLALRFGRGGPESRLKLDYTP